MIKEGPGKLKNLPHLLIGSSQLIGSRPTKGIEFDRSVQDLINAALSAGADGWNVFALPELRGLINWFNQEHSECSLVLTVGANEIDDEIELSRELNGDIIILVHSRIVDGRVPGLLEDFIRLFRSRASSIWLSSCSPCTFVERNELLDRVDAIAAPVNGIGFGMRLSDGTIAQHLDALTRIRQQVPVYAFSVMAKGRLPMSEGIGFAAEFADGLFIGTNNPKHARLSVRRAEELISRSRKYPTRVPLCGSVTNEIKLGVESTEEEIEWLDQSTLELGRGAKTVFAQSRPAAWGFGNRRVHKLCQHHTDSLIEAPVATPEVLIVELTGNCNYKCIHCYSDWGSESIDQELVADAIKVFAQREGKVLKLSGGEPLLHPGVHQLVATGLKHGLRAVLCTNGSLLDRSTVQLLKANDVTVQMSIDALDNPTADMIRGKGSLRRTRCVMELLAENMPGSWVCMTTIMKPNLSAIIPMLYKVVDYDPKQVTFSLWKPLGPAKQLVESLTPSPLDLIVLSEQLLQAKDLTVPIFGSPIEIARRDLLYKVGYPRCILGRQLRVDPRGNIFPCPQLADGEWIIGTLDQGLASAVDGIKLKTLAQEVFHRPKTIKACKLCFWRRYCQGGCPARCYSPASGAGRHDDLCSIRQYYFPRVLEEFGKVF